MRARHHQASTTSRAGKGLFVVVFLLVLGGLLVQAVIKRSKRPEPVNSSVEFPKAQEDIVTGWRGPAELEAAGFTLRLTPLHGNAERQAFDAIALAQKLGLPEGAPYRLQVQYDEEFAASSDFAKVADLVDAPAMGLKIVGEDGEHASALLGLGTLKVPTLEALFRIPATLSSGDRQLVLWGSLPSEGGELKLQSGSAELQLTSTRYKGQSLPRHVALLHPEDK